MFSSCLTLPLILIIIPAIKLIVQVWLSFPLQQCLNNSVCILLGEARGWTYLGMATSKYIIYTKFMDKYQWPKSIGYVQFCTSIQRDMLSAIQLSIQWPLDRSMLLQFSMHMLHWENQCTGKWWTRHSGNTMAYQTINTGKHATTRAKKKLPHKFSKDHRPLNSHKWPSSGNKPFKTRLPFLAKLLVLCSQTF